MKQVSNRVVIALIVIYVLVAVVQYSLVYMRLSVTSKVAGNVGVSVLEACNINLQQGWNYISICIEPPNKSIESVLAGINYRYVLLWNQSTGGFDVYSPKALSKPFDSFDTKYSYFIYAELPQQIQISGSRFGDMNISLSQGWAPPAWPYHFAADVSKYLSGIAGQYRYMLKWDASTQSYVVYSPRSSSPPFTQISLGEGQFILITDPAGVLLVYNSSYLQA